MTDYVDIYKKRILEYLKIHNKKPVTYKELYSKCKGRKNYPDKFKEAAKELVKSGEIIEKKKGFTLLENVNAYKAEVARIAKTFGFIKKDDGTEVFVPGKFLMGSMPGDIVLAKPLNEYSTDGECPEGMVIKILEENNSEFTGTLEKYNGRLYVRPDTLTKELIEISGFKVKAHEGDKISAKITHRGLRHSEHRCEVVSMFGSSERAESSAFAYLHINGVETEFPPEVLDEAKKIGRKRITETEILKRLDLRDEIIFTIDGADTKDIDDAVSVKKTDTGYILGVHIADVSHYVKKGTRLDEDAFLRGTSIYYADKVIPMLPKELSNGICSLNPNEDRLAFSAIMNLNEDGDIVSYKFSKTVIRSRVKGVYSEVNEILNCLENNTEIPEKLNEKYYGLSDTIWLMKILAEKLTAKKIKRGAPQIDSPECKLILDEDGVCVDVKKRERGESEVIIEEFMLMANTCAARLAREKEIPFVYRVHENPSPERIEELKTILAKLNVEVPPFSSVKPKHLSMILKNVKDKPYSLLINNMVLRSMAKAKYSDEPLGHFGLVLKDYSHFTSPIRRYPDLAIHRILTDLCYNKLTQKGITKKYTAFAKSAAEHSSECELVAMHLERDCEACYIAEYMRSHVGEKFTGIISAVTENGFFVELPSTAEGFVKIESLPAGQYDFDGVFTLSRGGKVLYKVGDSIDVECVKADVPSGKIDFIPVE